MDAKGKAKVEKVMHEYGQGELHSGSKHGPVVTSQKQAVAIAISEAEKASHGEDYPSKARKTVHHSPTMMEVDHSKTHQQMSLEEMHKRGDTC